MSDEKMKVDIGLDVHATGEDIIDVMTRKLDALNRKIRSINAGITAAARGASNPGRTQSQTKDGTGTKSARDALGFDRQAITALRQKLSLQGRLANQQARQEREALAAFKRRMSFQAKAEAQDVASIRTKATEEARAFRQRLAFTSRMGKLAIAEERKVASERARSVADAARQGAKRSRDVAASIRANARLEASEARRVDRERSARESARGRGFSNMRQGAGDVREGAGRAVRGAGAASAVAAAGTGAAVRRGISTRMDVDTSETAIRIFSGQTQEQIRSARKGWLDTEAIKNGLSVSGGLDAYGEVLKAGLKGPVENTKSIMAATSALELDLKQTTKLAGLIDRNYGEASTPAKIKSALNAIAVAAREDPTAAPEIVEGMKRGFGVLSMGNMTPEDLAAFVSGGQSVGIQPGKAGTFIATLGKQLSSGANRFLGKKNRQELNFAASKLGFGNAKAMANAFQGDSTGTIFKVLEGLKAADAQTRTTIAGALSGNQWNDEDLQIVNGLDGLKSTYNAIRDSKNSGFLDEAAAQRQASLQGQWRSTKAIFGRFWDSFGAGFEDILTSINRYFLDLNTAFDYDKVKNYVSEFMTGVREAFGVSTWRELLQSTFGGNLGNLGADIRAFGRGLADGILSIGRVIRSVMTVFGGASGGAETIGKLSGQFVALSIALVALAPVVSILGGLASIIAGIAIAGRGLAGLAGLGAVGAGAAGAGLMRGLGLALSRMFALSVVAEIGANRGTIATWMLDGAKSLLSTVVESLKSAFSKESLQEAVRAIIDQVIPAPLKRWMESDGQSEAKKGLGAKVLDGIGKPPVPVAPTERGILGKAWDWLSSSLVGSAHASEMEGRPPANGSATVKLTQAVNDNTAALKSSFDSPVTGLGGLIQRASITGTGSASAVRSSITDSANQIRSGGVGAPVLSGSTAGGSGFGGSPLAGSTPGSALGSGGGRLSSRGILGGVRSGTPQVGSSDNSPIAPHAGRTFNTIAPRLMADLQKDFGLTKEQAAGVVGNLGHESAGMTAFQEKNPLGGGRGGWGYAQWTGPRRRQFEAYAQAKGLDPKSYEANYGFLRHELQTSEKGGIAAVKRHSTLEGATVGFERAFERAGVKHDASRLKWARRAAGLPVGAAGVEGLVVPSLGKDLAASETLKSTGWRKASEGITTSAGAIKSSGWKPGLGGNASDGAAGRNLGTDAPVRVQNTQPIGGAASSAGAGGGSSVHAPITIQGAGQDAESIANAVQRKLNEKMMRRTNDLSPSSLSV